MQAVRYRTGIDRATGGLLRGIAHVHQSLEVSWTTRFNSRIMFPAFFSDLRSHLSEDITPGLALSIYATLVDAAHTHEPEYRISSLRLVRVTREGGIGRACCFISIRPITGTRTTMVPASSRGMISATWRWL